MLIHWEKTDLDVTPGRRSSSFQAVGNSYLLSSHEELALIQNIQIDN